MELQAELLDAVKNYLDITWVDESTDIKITGITERGIKYINRIAGSEMDYLVEDKPRELLLDYCVYARSKSLNEFQINYMHELLSLQISMEVAAYEPEDTVVQ